MTLAADRATVVAWLRANGWTYSKAARHFGLPKGQVTAWGKEARGAGSPARAPVRETMAPASLADLSRLDALRAQLDDVQSDIADFRGNEKATTALLGSRRLVRELIGDIKDEELRLKRAGEDHDDSSLTPEEQMGAIVELVAIAPEPLVDALEAAIHARRNPIRLVKA